MELSYKEAWTAIHGMVFGSAFLLSFAGGLAGLWSLRPELVTVAGMRERLTRLSAGTWIMALAAWATVISGTWIVYPWYRQAPPAGLTGAALAAYPRYFLLANQSLAEWHTFGMEWKEHVAWFAPMLATAVAFIVVRYGARISNDPKMRWALMVLFTAAFATAAVAGLFGAFITKAAPLH
jgi:hypothetical protein